VFIKLTAEEKLMSTDCSISDCDWVQPLCSVDNWLTLLTKYY